MMLMLHLIDGRRGMLLDGERAEIVLHAVTDTGLMKHPSKIVCSYSNSLLHYHCLRVGRLVICNHDIFQIESRALNGSS